MRFWRFVREVIDVLSFARPFITLTGTVHGFGVRPDLKVPVVAEAFKAALDQTCEWFKKTLV